MSSQVLSVPTLSTLPDDLYQMVGEFAGHILPTVDKRARDLFSTQRDEILSAIEGRDAALVPDAVKNLSTRPADEIHAIVARVLNSQGATIEEKLNAMLHQEKDEQLCAFYDALPVDIKNLLVHDFAGATTLRKMAAGIQVAFDRADLSSVTHLYLDNKNLLRIPGVLSKFTNLEILSLCGNQLTEAPDLSGLTNLRYLNLHGNQLTEAPILTGLTNLRSLSLVNNQLTEAPVLTGLTNLQYLDLYNNQLTEAPVLTGLTNLQILYLHGNPLVSVSVDALPYLSHDNQRRRAYLHEIRDHVDDLRYSPRLHTLGYEIYQVAVDDIIGRAYVRYNGYLQSEHEAERLDDPQYIGPTAAGASNKAITHPEKLLACLLAEF